MSLRDIFTFNRRPVFMAERPLRGVNLGGWLLLEKWMTPSLFDGTEAADEYTFCKAAGTDALRKLRQHRDSFITKADFEWLKQQGIQAVRLPVGYWTFGDEAPYMSTIDYVDKAFRWANETGIKVLLDMHGAPGSQNGKDHSGCAGDCTWHKQEDNTIKTLSVLTRLTKRYASEPSLLGIELLNEPSADIPRRVLMRYYKAAYKMIRSEAGESILVVFSDTFKPRRWKRKLRQPRYQNMFIDTHQYQTFSAKDKKLDVEGHVQKTIHYIPKVLRKMQRTHPVIVGEWSLALDPESMHGLDVHEVEAARRAYAAAQLLAYSTTSAWFYWNYKTDKGGVWSFRSCIDRGWLPRFTDNT